MIRLPRYSTKTLLIVATVVPMLCYAGLRAVGPTLESHCHRGGWSLAIGPLHAIRSGQERYRQTDWDGDGILEYATTLSELSSIGLIDNQLGSGRRGGYLFRLCSDGEKVSCSAVPEDPGKVYRCRRGWRSCDWTASNPTICIIDADGVVDFSYTIGR